MAPRIPKKPTVIGKDLIDTDTKTPTARAPRKTTAKKPAAKKASPRKRAPAKKPATPPVPDPVDPWDQQPGETTQAYLAFLVYRELGLTRSIVRVRRDWGNGGSELGVNPDKPPSQTSIDKWSSDNQWAIRVQAYDKHLDRVWVLEKRERQRRAARRNADMAARAMGLVAARLEQMEKFLQHDSDHYDADAPVLDVLDLRRLVDSLGKLERLALDESTENVKVTGKDGGPVQVDYTKLTDEERVERLRHIRAELDKRLDGAGGAA